MKLNESIVEDAAPTWFGELGYLSGHGRSWLPVNRRRRGSFADVVLAGRLRDASCSPEIIHTFPH